MSEANAKPLVERNEIEKQESKLRSMYGKSIVFPDWY
jgi:hypothetical protein